MEQLAAREVRRYVYLRSGRLLPMRTEPKGTLPGGDLILVARKDRPLVRAGASAELIASLGSLAPQSYRLKTIPSRQSRVASHRVLLVTGGDDAGTLYAAYHLAEVLGVRFYLHGDVIPDEPMEWKLPDLDERAAPLFALRGIQPFHDFPEGPDWWNRDDYQAVIGQLPKLRMNFFGLHTYPEERPNAEPTVWIGLASGIGEHGQVKTSYPSSYMNTLRGNWGYAAERTSDYSFGSAALFERDDFGPEVMFGFMPAPATPEASNQVFDRSAVMLRDAFRFAHQVGVKTCVGTETPLVIPKPVQERLKTKARIPLTQRSSTSSMKASLAAQPRLTHLTITGFGRPRAGRGPALRKRKSKRPWRLGRRHCGPRESPGAVQPGDVRLGTGTGNRTGRCSTRCCPKTWR